MNMSLLLLEFACGALLCSLLLIPGLAARFNRNAQSYSGAMQTAKEADNCQRAADRQPGGGR